MVNVHFHFPQCILSKLSNLQNDQSSNSPLVFRTTHIGVDSTNLTLCPAYSWLTAVLVLSQCLFDPHLKCIYDILHTKYMIHTTRKIWLISSLTSDYNDSWVDLRIEFCLIKNINCTRLQSILAFLVKFPCTWEIDNKLACLSMWIRWAHTKYLGQLCSENWEWLSTM